MATVETMNAIAATDSTFTRVGREWLGKCLICAAPLRFDALTGDGATIEHIIPRSAGGDNSPLNLGLAHFACNAEKGRNWDRKQARRRRNAPDKYDAIVGRMLTERKRRWREGEL